MRYYSSCKFLVWLRRMMTKPCLVLDWTQAPGSHTTTGLAAPCARIAIILVQHSVLGKWPYRRCLSPSWRKGAPREARCKDRCQRCRGHRRLCYLAQALGDITNAHRPLCGVQSSSHATVCFPCLPQVSRVPSQQNPTTWSQVCRRPQSQAHGTCKCHPRRYHVSRPSSPSVTWTFGHLDFRYGLPCALHPGGWSLQPLHTVLIKNPPLDAGSQTVG